MIVLVSWVDYLMLEKVKNHAMLFPLITATCMCLSFLVTQFSGKFQEFDTFRALLLQILTEIGLWIENLWGRES